MDFLTGFKTYIAAAGLVGLSVYQVSIGDFETGVQTLLAALAVFGLRKAVN